MARNTAFSEEAKMRYLSLKGILGKNVAIFVCCAFCDLPYIQDMDVEDLERALSVIEQYKLSINDYLDLMMMWYRDVLMFKVTNSVDKLLFKSEYMHLKKQAGMFSYNSIEEKINAIERAKVRLDVNANFDTTMQLLLLTLKEN